MRKLKTFMIASVLIIAVASPIFAKDIATRPPGRYYSTNAHHGQGQQLGGKSGERSKKGLGNAYNNSKGAIGRRSGGKDRS